MRRRWVAAVGTATLVVGLLAAAASGSRAAQPSGPQNGRIFFSTGVLLPNPDNGDATVQIYSVNPDGTGLTQLTHVPAGAAAGGPGVSPDGSTVAYTSNENGDYSLWLMDADGSHQREVLATPHTDYFTPSWSPDGSTLVMTSCDTQYGFDADCPLVTVRPDGTGLRTLLDNRRVNTTPTYSPSGTRVQFSSDQKGLVGALWVIRATGGTPKQVTAPEIEAGQAAWSPDGRRLLFGDHCCEPHSNLYSITPRGDHLTQLTNVPVGEDAYFPTYSPDGRYVAYFSDPGQDQGDLFVMDADGTHQHSIVDSVPAFQPSWGVAPGTARPATRPAVAAGIHLSAYTSARLRSAAGTHPAGLGAEGASSAPDGRISFTDGDRGIITTVNPDGTGLLDVTTEDEGYAVYSAWTPDGSHLVVAVFTGDRDNLYEVAADGTGWRLLDREPKGVYAFDPQVTPDGTWVLFSRYNEKRDGSALWAIHPDGTGKHPVTRYLSQGGNAGYYFSAISRDGTRLAVDVRNREGINTQVWVGDLSADATLTNAHPITRVADEASAFSWSADGEYVLGTSWWFHFGDGIYAFPAAGGDPVQLVQPTYPHQAYEPFVSPSGQLVAYIAERDVVRGPRDLTIANIDGSGSHSIATGGDYPIHPQWGTAPPLPTSAATSAVRQPPLSPERLAQIRAAMPEEVQAELDH